MKESLLRYYSLAGGALLNPTPLLAILEIAEGERFFKFWDPIVLWVLNILVFFISLTFCHRWVRIPLKYKIRNLLILYLVLCLLGIAVHSPLWMTQEKMHLDFFIRDEFLRNGIIFSLSYAAVHFYDMFKENQQYKTYLAEIKSQQLSQQLESLRQQINPHFFFNSLNTLSGLVEENPTKGILFIDKLSQVFRYVLKMQERHLVSLEEEMAFAKAYIFLLEIRFSGKLFIQNEIEEGQKWYVPGMCTQLLIENVIKHNRMNQWLPVKIHIYLEEDYLVVSNSYRPHHERLEGGLGLKNLNSRCELLMGRGILVSNEHNSLFIVKVPLTMQHHENHHY